jgi:hypothetical protein
VAARRPGWDARTATRVFSAAAIGFAVVIAFAGAGFVHGVWSESRQDFQTVAAALDAAGASPQDRVMSIDASGTRYWTGRGGVVLVNDPLETIEKVARAYDIRWLVLDRGDAVRSVAPILDGTVRPAWLGEPVMAAGSPTRLAIYPIRPAP